MRAHSNGGLRGLAFPDRKGNHGGLSNGVKNSSTDNLNNNNNGSASSDSKRGTSSGSDAIPVVWPPKFVIGLTTKEKEEDFMAIKGSKLPQRPKKRAKFIQRTLNIAKLLSTGCGHSTNWIRLFEQGVPWLLVSSILPSPINPVLT